MDVLHLGKTQQLFDSGLRRFACRKMDLLNGGSRVVVRGEAERMITQVRGEPGFFVTCTRFRMNEHRSGERTGEAVEWVVGEESAAVFALSKELKAMSAWPVSGRDLSVDGMPVTGRAASAPDQVGDFRWKSDGAVVHVSMVR